MKLLILLLLTGFLGWYSRLDKPRFKTLWKKLKRLGWRRYKVITDLGAESPPVQAHNKIADSLFLSSPNGNGNGCRAFLITSAGPKEGKTTMAVNLALTMAKRKRKVLFMNTDLRNPKADRFFKLNKTPGLLDVVEQQLPLENALRREADLWVLPAGNIGDYTIAPVEFFGSEGMKRLMERLRAEFDLLIMDSPCIKSYRDALVLSSLADGVILVAEADKTPKRAILMAQEKITNVNGNFQGIVLNKQISRVPLFMQNILR